MLLFYLVTFSTHGLKHTLINIHKYFCLKIVFTFQYVIEYIIIY